MEARDRQDLWLTIAIFVLLFTIIVLVLGGSCTKAHARTLDRRGILITVVNHKLALHEPYEKGKSDCSSQMWDILSKVFPEFKIYKWFHRTTVETMAGWPWTALMRLDDARLGDLLFSGFPRFSHIMMAWRRHKTLVHASSSRGFVESNLRPYWYPRITLVVRPPY